MLLGSSQVAKLQIWHNIVVGSPHPTNPRPLPSKIKNSIKCYTFNPLTQKIFKVFISVQLKSNLTESYCAM